MSSGQVIRTVNRLLAHVGMRWCWQNLHEPRHGSWGKTWRHGRAWLWLRQDERGGNPRVEVEWVFGYWRCGTALIINTLHSDDDLTLSLSFPGLSVYLSTDGLLPRWLPRPHDSHRVGWDIHSGGLWWDIWQNDFEYHSGTPWWQHGHFDPVDFALGRRDHRKRMLEVREIVVRMPERTYPATVTVFESTWTRRRWPHWPLTRRMTRSTIEVEGGIPVPGKGENAWDCGEDAIYSLTSPAATVEAAVTQLAESVQETRRRYGSQNWRPVQTKEIPE